MSTAELRMSIIEKVLQLGDEALEKLNSLAEKEVEQGSVPESHYKQLDRELASYKNGEKEANTWDDVEKRARAKIGL